MKRYYQFYSLSLLLFSLQPYSTIAATVETVTELRANETGQMIAQLIKNIIATQSWEKEATEEIYRLSGHQLIWLNNKHTEQVLDLLNHAETIGLNPDNYNRHWLENTWQKLNADPEPSFHDLAAFDTTLSYSLLSYLSDVTYGRINPQKVRFDFEVNKEHLKLALATFNAIKDGSVVNLANKLEPTFVFYRHLKQGLLHYHQALHLKPVHFNVSLSNQNQSQLAQLRQLLIALGDIPHTKTLNSHNNSYDKILIEGLKQFQKRHGLAAKGFLNAETVAALNVPLNQRIAQIELGLERLRWIPRSTEDRFVMVNIPSFQLWAFDSLKNEAAKPLVMRVVVGEALDKQTPILSSKMEYLDFRPYWNVPPSIIRNEIMPKLGKNSSYLAKHGMEMIREKNGSVTIRQVPGIKNALGLVKFVFPNHHSVYFHDTPSKRFFNMTRRDFSHGCVRLAEPALLAEYALKHQAGDWTMAKIKAAMEAPKPKRVAFKQPIPVVIFYSTVMAAENSSVSFLQDIYGHDQKLIHELELSKSKPLSI
jgi:murein L,D-transpeptidase YcbB/YkuD